MRFAPFLNCPLRGVECAASAKVRVSLTVVFRFACLATWWRGLFEQCVVDFCSVPRGGVKKKKSVEATLDEVVNVTKEKKDEPVPSAGVNKAGGVERGGRGGQGYS